MEQGLLADRVLRRPLTCRKIRVFMFFTNTSAPAGKPHVLRKENHHTRHSTQGFYTATDSSQESPWMMERYSSECWGCHKSKDQVGRQVS